MNSFGDVDGRHLFLALHIYQCNSIAADAAGLGKRKNL
jgi:hypothetical protein